MAEDRAELRGTLAQGPRAGAIVTEHHGYRLAIPADEIDAGRFERLLGRARELLTLGEAERSAYLVQEALHQWPGEPYVE